MPLNATSISIHGLLAELHRRASVVSCANPAYRAAPAAQPTRRRPVLRAAVAIFRPVGSAVSEIPCPPPVVAGAAPRYLVVRPRWCPPDHARCDPVVRPAGEPPVADGRVQRDAFAVEVQLPVGRGDRGDHLAAAA